MDEDTSEAHERAAWFRGNVLTSSDHSIRAELERIVVRGIERGVVALDESGLAAVLPMRPPPPKPAQGAPWEVLQAWSADPWFVEYKEAKDLEFALTCAHMQEVALRALGAPMVSTGVYEQLLAMTLIRDLAPVASGMAPEHVVKRVRPALEAQAEAYEGEKIWHSALKNAFLVVDWTARPRAQVEFVLELLRAGTTELPAALRTPTAAQLARADIVMRDLRAKGVGRRKGRWAMARAFARAFSCELPARERDARRRKGARSLLA